MKKNTLRAALLALGFINAITWSQNSLDFDGVNDRVDCGNDESINITGDEITLEAWIYPTEWADEVWAGSIINKEQYGGGSGGYMLRCGDGGKLSFNIGDPAGGWDEMSTPIPVLVLNEWQHVAATYQDTDEGGIIRMYLNGTSIGFSSSTEFHGISEAPGANLTIGDNAGGGRNFSGKIDEVKIWDITRSAIEISYDMNTTYCEIPLEIDALKAYYQFNEGEAEGDNFGETTLNDQSGNENDGALSGFSLSGSSSNWVTGVSDLDYEGSIETGESDLSVCDSYTLPSGIIVTTSGSYTETIVYAESCNEIHTFNITILESNEGVDIIEVCDSYTWMDDITYTESTDLPTYILTNADGCDSVVTLNLTILESTEGTDIIEICDSYTWINDVTYTESTDLPTHTLTNAHGCDSVVTLNLTILESNEGIDVVEVCDSYTWIDGITYTESTDLPTHTLTNAHGCDSVVTLNLTIFDSDEEVDLIEACDSYTWIDGITYTESTDLPTYILTNIHGCDSIVNLNLTINTVDIFVTVDAPNLTSNADDAVYQWVDCDDDFEPIPGATNQTFEPLVNGNYAVIVEEDGCEATSECYSITNVGISEFNFGEQFSVFPNPTTSNVELYLTHDTEYVEVELVNSLGETIKRSKASSLSHNLIEIPDSKGVYLLKLTDKNNAIHIVKIIKI